MRFILNKGKISFTSLTPSQLNKGKAMEVSNLLPNNVKHGRTGWDKVNPANINPHMQGA